MVSRWGGSGAVGEAGLLVEGVPGSNSIGENEVRRLVAVRRHARGHRRGAVGVRVWAAELTWLH